MTQYALDNKHDGDKLWAFETNGIMKALRALFNNFLDKWGFIGKSVITFGANTIPSRCNFIVITCELGVSAGDLFKGDVILMRSGKTVGSFIIPRSGGNCGADFSLSGDVLTISGGNNNPAYSLFTAYFYS